KKENNMSDKIHRVVVTLTDATHKLSSSCIRESQRDCEINVLDKTTLLLHMKSSSEGLKAPRYYQQMQFDAVGYEDDVHIRDEFNGLLAQMFRFQRNGCLMRLTPRRSHNVKLLSRFLVTDVEKLLRPLPYSLDSINVEYYDVRKFDMINMLMPSRHGQSKIKEQPSQRELLNTRDLFQWLHNEYSIMRTRGSGDGYINVEFVLTFDKQKQMRLYLSIFNIFDCIERKDVPNFFQKLPSGKTKQGTLLTDCIKESFDYKRPVFTMVLCELPLDRGSAKEMHRFLQLADMAYMNINAASNKVDLHVKPFESILSLPTKSRSSIQLLDRCSSARCFESSSLRCRPGSLSPQDYSKLASWYRRIDTKFSEVKKCMERHYDVQYRQKFMKICKQLRSRRPLLDKSGGDADAVLLKNSANDLLVTARYVEALKQFRQLEKEVGKCCFACTLSTYMSTKNFELLNVEKALQQQEIANL
ncbi:hypothetical protein KR222_007313, partial [Zaprionus bogoriensis]